jgi:hypothetical protein
MMPTRPYVDVASLRLGPELGSGGQGTVTAVGDYLINGQWPAVLKTYSSEVAGSLDTAALDAIVEFPGQLDPADSTWLHEATAWPAAIAGNSGTACGFLMRTVPPAYHFDFRTQSRGIQRKLADVAFLLNPDAYVGSSGLSVSDRDRLALLSTLAATLCRLHSLGVAVGDLSPKNLLFTINPVPGCFIIDCDAAYVRDRTVLPQVETPDWEVPPGELTATPAADAYKFSLLAARLFARDQSSRDPSALAGLTPQLGHLAYASLYGNPASRPTLQEWIPALGAASPTVSTARISVPIPPLDFPAGQHTPTGQHTPSAPATRNTAVTPTRRGPAVALALAAAIILVIVIVAFAIHSSAPSSSISQGNAGGSTAQGNTGSGGQDSGSSAPGNAASVTQSPLDQLSAIKSQDQSAVQGLAENSWVPILSSKQVGTVDPQDAEFPNQAYSNKMILQNFKYWRNRYSSALLFQSQSYSSLVPGYWSTILNQPYSTSGDVISWCRAQGLNPDDCDATLLSNHLPQGPQTYRGW